MPSYIRYRATYLSLWFLHKLNILGYSELRSALGKLVLNLSIQYHIALLDYLDLILDHIAPVISPPSGIPHKTRYIARWFLEKNYVEYGRIRCSYNHT